MITAYRPHAVASDLLNIPSAPRRTDAIDTVDVASDGRKSGAQERIRTAAKEFLAQERTCLSDGLYASLEERAAEILARQDVERMDLLRSLAAARDEVLAESALRAADAARKNTGAVSEATLPPSYLPVEKYFGLAPEALAEIRSLERQTGLAVLSGLARYQVDIERALSPTDDSTMPPEKLEALKASVRAMIGTQAQELRKAIRSRASVASDGSLTFDRRDRWMINHDLQEALDVIGTSVISSARFAILMHSPAYRTAIEGSAEYRGDIHTRGHVMGRAKDAEEAFFAKTEARGDIPNGLIRHDNWIKRNTIEQTLEAGDRFIEGFSPPARPDLRLGGTRPAVFVTEKDADTERKVVKAYMAAVGMQAVPVMNLPSMMVDAADIISPADVTLEMVKAGLGSSIDQGYRMDKSWYDHLGAALGVVAGTMGVQAGTKARKAGRLARWFSALMPESNALDAVRAAERARPARAIARPMGTEANAPGLVGTLAPLSDNERRIVEAISEGPANRVLPALQELAAKTPPDVDMKKVAQYVLRRVEAEKNAKTSVFPAGEVTHGSRAEAFASHGRYEETFASLQRFSLDRTLDFPLDAASLPITREMLVDIANGRTPYPNYARLAAIVRACEASQNLRKLKELMSPNDFTRLFSSSGPIRLDGVSYTAESLREAILDGKRIPDEHLPRLTAEIEKRRRELRVAAKEATELVDPMREAVDARIVWVRAAGENARAKLFEKSKSGTGHVPIVPAMNNPEAMKETFKTALRELIGNIKQARYDSNGRELAMNTRTGKQATIFDQFKAHQEFRSGTRGGMSEEQAARSALQQFQNWDVETRGAILHFVGYVETVATAYKNGVNRKPPIIFLNDQGRQAMFDMIAQTQTLVAEYRRFVESSHFHPQDFPNGGRFTISDMQRRLDASTRNIGDPLATGTAYSRPAQRGSGGSLLDPQNDDLFKPAGAAPPRPSLLDDANRDLLPHDAGMPPVANDVPSDLAQAAE